MNLNFNTIIMMAARVLALAVAFPFHESAHGLAALALGDKTAKNSHRISMNPFRHFDLLGFILLMLVGFGWGKPVPINPDNFKHKKSGIAITALAGPFSNLVLAYISIIVFNLFYILLPGHQFIQLFLYYSIFINISLMLFNLIPVLPLDGSRILYYFMDDDAYFNYSRYSTVLFIVLLVLLEVLDRTGIYSRIVKTVFNALDDCSLFVEKIFA